jgi:hypothetical protein
VARFPLGKLVATPDALALLQKHSIDPFSLLVRHVRGDWGDLSPVDKATNEKAVQEGLRVFSSYAVGDEKVWVITEADRSSTCLLLPENY